MSWDLPRLHGHTATGLAPTWIRGAEKLVGAAAHIKISGDINNKEMGPGRMWVQLQHGLSIVEDNVMGMGRMWVQPH
jgi:hypothetical protein